MPSRVSVFGDEERATTIWLDGNAVTPDSCPNFYRSVFMEGYFYKECETGLASRGAYASVPAGMFVSQVSQEAADAAAAEELEARGQAALAAAGFECDWSSFEEIFSYVWFSYNWDYISDRATLFPREVSWDVATHNEPWGQVPLLGYMCHDTTTLAITSEQLPEADWYQHVDKLSYTVEPTHGLMHFDIKNVDLTVTDLNFRWSPVVASFKSDLENPNTFAPMTFMGMLVGDFGSTDIMDCELGGCLFTAPFAPQVVGPGVIKGTYLVCYKETLKVWVWDEDLEEYVVALDTLYDARNATSYLAIAIEIRNDSQFLVIYLDGYWQGEIEDTNVYRVEPAHYMRGVTSVDYWFGDLAGGLMRPNMNRIPPAMHTIFLPPTTVDIPEQESPTMEGYLTLKASTVDGAATAVEAFSAPILLGEEYETGISLELTDGTSIIAPVAGGYPGEGSNCSVLFDYTGDDTVPDYMFGCNLMTVGSFLHVRYATFPYVVNGSYKHHFWQGGVYTPLTVAEYPPEVWQDRIFSEDYMQGNADVIRHTCWVESSPMGVPEVSETDENFGEYLPSIPTYIPRQRWLEPTQYYDIFFDQNPDVFNKTQLAARYCWVQNGWSGFRIEDQFEVTDGQESYIKSVRLVTSVKGKRTSDILDAPVYDPIPCEVVECVDPYVNTGVMTSYGVFTGTSGDLVSSDSNPCDNFYARPLYDGAVCESLDDVVTLDPGLVFRDFISEGVRYFRLTVNSQFAILLDPLTDPNGEILLNTMIRPIRLKVFREDWPLPIFDERLEVNDSFVNPPGEGAPGGCWFPPSASVEYVFTDGRTTPYVAETGVNYYFEITAVDPEGP